jgi:hypothetical protein
MHRSKIGSLGSVAGGVILQNLNSRTALFGQKAFHMMGIMNIGLNRFRRAVSRATKENQN